MSAIRASSDEAIREHAYYLWEQNGRPMGQEVEFWERAKALIDEARPAKPRAKAAAAAKAPVKTAKAATQKVAPARVRVASAKTETAKPAKPKSKA